MNESTFLTDVFPLLKILKEAVMFPSCGEHHILQTFPLSHHARIKSLQSEPGNYVLSAVFISPMLGRNIADI